MRINAAPPLSLQLIMCWVVTWRALTHEGWSGVGAKIVLTLVLGYLMNLSESALWDTLEPFAIGEKGFGAGRTVHKPMSTKKPASASAAPAAGGGASGGGPRERVTAASSIRGGDPAQAAAASAFTQTELDTLASVGIAPWDPAARKALAALEGGGASRKKDS